MSFTYSLMVVICFAMESWNCLLNGYFCAEDLVGFEGTLFGSGVVEFVVVALYRF